MNDKISVNQVGVRLSSDLMLKMLKSKRLNGLYKRLFQ
jgi:hypothetical protein